MISRIGVMVFNADRHRGLRNWPMIATDVPLVKVIVTVIKIVIEMMIVLITIMMIIPIKNY